MPDFQLERSIAIKAPAASVFSNVKNFKNWSVWSPWILAEPGCKLSYADDGLSYSWDGSIIGSGAMEVLESVENEAIRYRLTFLKPFKSVSTVSFRFDESNGETNTHWSMSGSLPFFLFWMKRMMVAGIEMDYDRGLRMLKDHVELGSVPSDLKFSGIEKVDGFDYAGLNGECDYSELSAQMKNDFEKLCSATEAAGIVPAGAPVSFYSKFEIADRKIGYTVALPVATGTRLPEGIEAGKLPTIKCYTIHHTGPYRHVGNPWAAGMIHQRAKVFSSKKAIPPFEVYRNDPGKVPESELLTSVYFPIK